ncbi:hypothetical protein Celal_1665 [Cellulophaga algicola DSM 14237]|uniref:Uncharacterized protein n=1 Tax=Cellulophaga algicola (strain DSM 14237 / IC166 / ACAM 630) TaxID=688270 RepID=E6XBX1_CELAD|nr:hypothetical protein [Cellulophaga algicola]ADV48973.1 hypothetical protein Celal_1665 [Cellulophaga algicola DSM 14237]
MAKDLTRAITHENYGKAESGLQKYYHKVEKIIYHTPREFTKESIEKGGVFNFASDDFMTQPDTSNGVPVACIGDMTAHGGAITVGEPNVIIGSATPTPSITMAVNKIPFPEIASNASNKEARANQQLLREAAEDIEGEPRIYNLQWIKGDKFIRESRLLKEVTLRAYVENISEGEIITLKVNKIVDSTDENQELNDDSEELIEIKGTVKDKMVEVTWTVELPDSKSEKS